MIDLHLIKHLVYKRMVCSSKSDMLWTLQTQRGWLATQSTPPPLDQPLWGTLAQVLRPLMNYLLAA